MATRINHQYPRRPAAGGTSIQPLCPAGEACGGNSCVEGYGCGCGAPCECTRCVPFCETMTLHESFDTGCICATSGSIAYDTDFLGYTLDLVSMDAQLPCGGTCPVDVYRVSINGAIPYIISVGPVSSGCGSSVCVSVEGVCMVDEVIGYVCGDVEPELTELDCRNIIADVAVETENCACSESKNITVKGSFCFNNLPVLQG